MRAEKRRRQWLTASGLIVAIAALCVALWPRNRQLLQLATRVTPDNRSQRFVSDYVWLSDQEVILCGYDMHFNQQMLSVDVTHRTARIIPGWQQNNMPASFFFTHTSLSVSPDHQRLLWVDRGIDTSEVCGARLDGTQHFFGAGSDHYEFAGRIFWLRDSIHWLEFRNNEMPSNTPWSANRYNFLKPNDKKVETVPLPPSRTQSSFVISRLVSDQRVLGVSWWQQDGPIMDVDVIDIKFACPNPVCRTFRVLAPPNTAIRELQFSPTGERIAWLVENNEASPMMAYLRRRFPIMKMVPNGIVGIWVCRLDGSRMHEIGTIPLASANDNPDGLGSPVPDNLQWLPGGKHLSFTYRRDLYTIPAD